MHNTALPKKTHNNRYNGYLLAIACISLLLFALTSGTFAVPLTSNEQISHTSNELSAAGSGGLAAGHGVNVTASRAGGAVFDAAKAAEGAGNTGTTQAVFSGIGGANSRGQEHEPAWQEPDAEDGSDSTGGGGVAPSGIYMVEAEPDTAYIFSARGISSDFNGAYEPCVTAMEVDGNCMKIVEHNLSFSGCYDWVEKEITFTTSPNVSEFYVSMNTWECGGTFQVEDVVLEVYEVPLPGISGLGHTAGRTWINWTWVNPDDVRFAYVTVQLNGTYMGVTPDPFYNATGLDSGGCYEIGVRTVDVGGNVSETGVNQTAETAAGDDDAVVAGKVVHATKEDFDGGMADGVEVQKYGVITLERKNLLENPSFEIESSRNGLAEDWDIYNPSGGDYITTLDTSTFTSGSKSQKIAFSSSGSAIDLMQRLYDVENNTDYTFSADVKVDDPDNMSAKLLVELWGDGDHLTSGGSIVTESTSFARLSMTITTTPYTDEIRVFVHLTPKFYGAAGTLWVDSAQIEMNDNPTPYAPCYTTTSGEYISPPIDMGMTTTPYKMEWTSSVNPYGDIRFQIRSADSLEELNSSPWYGHTSTGDYYARFEGDNLLLNPSLESDSDGDGVPDYSRQLGWGVNDVDFTVVDDAYEGSKAVKVEITNYTSGDSRWELLYDGTIEKDSDYLFSLWHKENGNIGSLHIAVGLEKPDGSTIWAYSSKEVSSLIDWKHNTLFFHTPNYEVEKIWLNIFIDKEGWIISDAYNLKKVNCNDEWEINPVHNNSRWIQYKIDFSTTDQTCSQSLHDITIRYGASVPEIHWANVLTDDGRQRYAFKPGETANFKIEVLDFKGIANMNHVNISIFDSNNNLVLYDGMTEGTDVSNVMRYYKYSYTFPADATMGVWRVNITAVNNEGQNYSEDVFLKIIEPYIYPPQKMTLGAVAHDYGFTGDVHADIGEYSKYPGLEIWKLGISWDHLEPDHGSFDEDYVNKILEFMDGAYEHGAKVQIAIGQTWWSAWVNGGEADSNERYTYKPTTHLADTWMQLADRIKDHPAMDSYLIINEENHVYDADIYLRGLNKVASSIREVDGDFSHRITIRPNTADSYIRTRIGRDGIQDYDYGTGVYPTSWATLTHYEFPTSDTSCLRMSKLRSSPVAYGCAGGVGEIGFVKAPMDTFGDDEKLVAFERAMSIAYDQGMDEFMLWQSSSSFADPETYFPKLKAFRDALVMQPRSSCFDVRILIDNGEWFYTGSPSTESALDMSNQPYRHLVETLDRGGYSWFYTYPDAVSLQNVCYKATINFSEIKGKTETEQDMLINERLEGITPSGTKYL